MLDEKNLVGLLFDEVLQVIGLTPSYPPVSQDTLDLVKGLIYSAEALDGESLGMGRHCREAILKIADMEIQIQHEYEIAAGEDL